MKTFLQIILLSCFSFFCSCQSNTNKNKSKDEAAISVDEGSIDGKTRTYTYPTNLFAQKNNIAFYGIGFNSTGQFAYVQRPCDGGCGCCTHEIVIQDLATDRIVSRLNLITQGVDLTENHKADWIRNKDRIAVFLNEHGILQNKMFVNNSNLINYKNNTYKVVTSQYFVEDAQSQSGSKMAYSASVFLNNYKSKVVTSGKETDGELFDYLGYIKSPFSNQLSLLFNKKYRGFEAEIVEEVVVVGCILDPNIF